MDLTLLVSMSMADAATHFERLEEAGSLPGEDFGLVGMHDGVLVPCHGIRPTMDERAPFVAEWAVQADESYPYGPEDVVLEWGSKLSTPPPVPEVPQEALERPWNDKGRRWDERVGLRGGGLVHRFGGDDDE